MEDCSRRGPANLDLRTHFLDLRGLLFKAGNDSLHPFLQLADCSFLFLYFASLCLDLFVFFKELVEQHRIHRLIADTVRLALVVASDQIGIHLFHLLGHQAELRDALGVKLLLVAESHWL